MPQRRAILLMVLVFLLGMFLARPLLSLGSLGGSGSFFDPIGDVYMLLERFYVTEPEQESLQRGAIDGMVEALGDQYTQYIAPEDVEEFEKQLTGRFVGIGAEVVMRGGWLTIVTPLEDSPAFEAGIRPGDRIVKIEGETTMGLTIFQCIARLTGEPGTPVNVTVERGSEQLEITIIRDHIVVRGIKGLRWLPEKEQWDHMLDPDLRIAYVRLTRFTPQVVDEMRETLESVGADKEGFGGLILDLRSNPGGILDAATGVADLFLEEGVIVTARGRAVGERTVRARKRGTLPEFPMLVLVNAQSASASEIVAGALSDHGRAVVLGTRTFGKGSVQTVERLPRSGAGQLKFTVQHYYLPSGRLIERTDDAEVWGVDPTDGFFIPVTEQEQIANLTRRRDLDVLQADDSDEEPDEALLRERWDDPEWIEEDLRDMPLSAALIAIRHRLARGEWDPVGESVQQEQAIASSELRRMELSRQRMLRELERIDRQIRSLSDIADATGAEVDLWPDEIDVAGGRLKVLDSEGNLVANLRIVGPNIERWLIDAGVEPIEDDPDRSAAAPKNGAATGGE